MCSSPAHHKDNTGNAHLHIDGVGAYKWKWVKAAQAENLTLAEWVKKTLNEAARNIPDELPESSGSGKSL